MPPARSANATTRPTTSPPPPRRRRRRRRRRSRRRRTRSSRASSRTRSTAGPAVPVLAHRRPPRRPTVQNAGGRPRVPMSSDRTARRRRPRRARARRSVAVVSRKSTCSGPSSPPAYAGVRSCHVLLEDCGPAQLLPVRSPGPAYTHSPSPPVNRWPRSLVSRSCRGRRSSSSSGITSSRTTCRIPRTRRRSSATTSSARYSRSTGSTCSR